MPWTVVKFLIPVLQAAPLNHRPVELKLSRLTDPKASLSGTSVQVAAEDCNPNHWQRNARTDVSSIPTQRNDDVPCIPRHDLYVPTPRVQRAIYDWVYNLQNPFTCHAERSATAQILCRCEHPRCQLVYAEHSAECL